jgi:hypothetical protein
MTKIFKISCYIFLLSILSQNTIFAKVTRYEKEVIKEKILSSFKVAIQQWQEELYFDLYDLGQTSSKTQLSKEEFAQRMVELKWKPATEKSAIKILTTTIFYRNYGLIKCQISYVHKVNVDKIFTREEEFEVKLEDKEWKFDLKKIIQTPF